MIEALVKPDEFVIDTDAKAAWALAKIKEARDDRDEWVAFYEGKIEEIKAQNEMLLKEREVVNAEKRFIQHGCDADLASEGAKALIDKDYEGLFSVIGKMLDNKAAFEKAELLRAIPKPQGGASKATMTKEQFNRLGYRERVELAEKDPETYKKFTA